MTMMPAMIVPLVLLRAVGHEAAHQRHRVDGEVEDTVDEPGPIRRQVVLGLQEEDQDGHHRVESETLSHVGEERDVEPLGMSFEHEATSTGRSSPDRPDDISRLKAASKGSAKRSGSCT